MIDKPIKYSYRIQYKEDVPGRYPWNHTVKFWVQRSSEIGSVLDGDWFDCGTQMSEWRHDPDWGHYENEWTETRYFDSSEKAKAWIDEQLAQYPKDYAAWQECQAGESARQAAVEAAAREAAARKAEEHDRKGVQVTYDSTTDTLRHRARVSFYISQFCQEMMRRAAVHDESKLHSPEKEAFDRETPLLAGLVYGSPEYIASEERLKDAIAHHHSVNSHHPEHSIHGISGMDLCDVVEMFCDWMASSERNLGGLNLELNEEKFKMSEQLYHILVNQHGWVVQQKNGLGQPEILE